MPTLIEMRLKATWATASRDEDREHAPLSVRRKDSSVGSGRDLGYGVPPGRSGTSRADASARRELAGRA
jgi:hypothetical protein